MTPFLTVIFPRENILARILAGKSASLLPVFIIIHDFAKKYKRNCEKTFCFLKKLLYLPPLSCKMKRECTAKPAGGKEPS